MIDIILCVYNSEETIEKCIDSILSQSYGLFKLYIFNDASTDGTIDVISKFKDSRINTITSKNNIGTYAGKNFVFKNYCQSDYVALHDADDYSEKERLSEQVDYLMSNKSCGCVGVAVREFWDKSYNRPHTVSSFDIVDNGDYKERINLYPSLIKKNHLLSLLKYFNGDKMDEDFFKVKFCMNGSIMLRKDIIDIVGGWDGTTKIGADTDLFIRILPHCDIHNINRVLYNRRFHNGSLTSSKDMGLKSDIRKKYALSLGGVIKETITHSVYKRDFSYPDIIGL
jgi:glycosyltransferase involved in cell wall biosynthesis